MKSKKAAVTAERAQLMHLFLAETDLREEKREGGTLGIMQKKKRESPRQSRSYSLKAREKREKERKKKRNTNASKWAIVAFIVLFFFRGWLPIV